MSLDGEAFTAAMATIRDDPALPRLTAACDRIVEQLRASAAAAVRQPTAYLPQLWDQVPHGRGRALAAQRNKMIQRFSTSIVCCHVVIRADDISHKHARTSERTHTHTH